MTTLSLPDTTYQRLAERAAGLNLSVEALLDRVAGVGPDLAADRPAGLRAFDDLIAGVPAAADPTAADRDRAYAELLRHLDGLDVRFPPGLALDDSREAIYAGCGE